MRCFQGVLSSFAVFLRGFPTKFQGIPWNSRDSRGFPSQRGSAIPKIPQIPEGFPRIPRDSPGFSRDFGARSRWEKLEMRVDFPGFFFSLDLLLFLRIEPQGVFGIPGSGNFGNLRDQILRIPNLSGALFPVGIPGIPEGFPPIPGIPEGFSRWEKSIFDTEPSGFSQFPAGIAAGIPGIPRTTQTFGGKKPPKIPPFPLKAPALKKFPK